MMVDGGEVLLGIEQNAEAFETERYPTYGFRPVCQEIKARTGGA